MYVFQIIQADGTMQHPVPVDPHMIPLNVIPTESNPIFQPTWQRMYPQTVEVNIKLLIVCNILLLHYFLIL